MSKYLTYAINENHCQQTVDLKNIDDDVVLLFRENAPAGDVLLSLYSLTEHFGKLTQLEIWTDAKT